MKKLNFINRPILTGIPGNYNFVRLLKDSDKE